MNIQSDSSQSPTLQRIASTRHQQWLVFLLFASFFWSGCRKEEEKGSPTVQILSPFDGFTIQVPDTFLVEFRVSDADVVESATISLNDANGVPVTAPVSVLIGTSSALVSRAFSVTNEGILSGNYTLSVRASNGTNDGSDFRSVTVVEAPLRLRAVFAGQATMGAGHTIIRIDSALNSSGFHSGPDELSGMAISSTDRMVHFAGTLNSPFEARDADAGTLRWQVANQNVLGTPYFTALSKVVSGRLHCATNEGYIRGYTAAHGNTQLTALCLAGHLTYSILSQDDRLVTEQVETVTGMRRLALYSNLSGVPLDQFPLDKTSVEMISRPGTEILLFGNRNGDGVVESRDILSGAFWEPRIFPQEAIQAVCSMGPDTYAIALPNELVRFTYSNAGVTSIASGVSFSSLAFDPVSGMLWAGGNGTVQLIDPTSGTTLSILPVPGATRYLLLLFNR